MDPGKGDTPPRICETCAAWDSDVGETHDEGECHRYAPRGGGLWPNTYRTEWCMEWVSKGAKPPSDELLDSGIEVLGLSVRARNCVEWGDDYQKRCATVRDVVRMTSNDLMRRRNLGARTMNEIASKLAAVGLRLGMDV